MAWAEEQDRLTFEARLAHASPDLVFQELKKLGARPRLEILGRDDRFETVLVRRNQPLINLGLACYGTNKDVFAALYRHSLDPAKSEADAKYKEGIRIGCLSNVTLPQAHFIPNFPKELIGEQETFRIISDGKGSETLALLRNPSVSEKFLEELYQRAGVFAQIPEERRADLVAYSANNQRLKTRKDTEDMPDMGLYGIHKAIFSMLETAPVERLWLNRLWDFLGHLDFQDVASPERIEHVLFRWAELDDRDSEGKPSEGFRTTLPLKDEFRCEIAALYGRGFEGDHAVQIGSPKAKDVALRCAYYGKGDMTAKEMKAGFKRDGDAFTFAVLFNPKIYFRRELQQLVEEEFLAGNELWSLYERHKALVKERKEQRRLFLGIGVESEKPTEAIEKQLNELVSQVSKLKLYVGWIGSGVLIVLMILLLR